LTNKIIHEMYYTVSVQIPKALTKSNSDALPRFSLACNNRQFKPVQYENFAT